MQQAVVERNTPYSDHFRDLSEVRAGEPAWLAERRAAAMQAFEARGFPSRRNEAWRNLDLGPVSGTDFRPVRAAGAVDAEVEALRRQFPEAHLLVLVDGHLSAAHSRLDQLPQGLTVLPLAEAVRRQESLLRTYLGQHAEAAEHPFAALNMALFEGGVLVQAGRNQVLERPLVLVHLASAAARQHAIYPRSLIVAEEGAQLQLVEVHRGRAGEYLNSPVTEIVAAPAANVDYYVMQESDPEAYHFGVVHARLDRDARVSLHSFAAGGKVGRTELYVDLAAPGAEVEMDGLYLLNEGQYIDHHTWVRHLSPHCRSHQLFKGVLAGRCQAVFDGLVYVAKGAQKTDAMQENRNLLLTPRAKVHSNPRLEIFADDVRCTHGSSMGELDETALFYLRSRGIDGEAAKGMLIYAFIAEVLEPVKIEALRQYQLAEALRILPGDLAIQELT